MESIRRRIVRESEKTLETTARALGTTGARVLQTRARTKDSGYKEQLELIGEQLKQTQDTVYHDSMK